MKKFMVFVLALMLTLLTTIPALADQVDVYQNNQLVKSVVFKIGVPEYVVNDKTPGVKMDVAPFIQNDRTFVPVRFLGNALGVGNDSISWDNGTQTATLKGANATLQMTIGQAQVKSNGVAKAIDVAPILRSDRTFLPARFVAEGLGYQVAWAEATQTVVCWPVGEPKPDVSAAVEYLNSQPVQQQPQDQTQANPYVPAGWKQVSYSGVSAYIPPGAKRPYPNVYYMGNSTIVQFDDADALNIGYPCKQFSNEKADQTAKDLLLANIGDPELVQQIWDYGAQKTTRGYRLPLKIFPGTGKFKKIQVANDDGRIGVTGIY